MLTDTQLATIMPTLAAAKRATFLPAINLALQTYTINNLLRAAAFLAQIAHESGELRFMEELWGPTDAQKRYEPPGTLAARLGNTQAGDGKRYKGRGPIQVTGCANYKRYGDLLGLDLISKPEQAATPTIGLSIAGMFWRTNGLNALAELGDFREITRRINGGFNGLDDRLKYYERAKAALGAGFKVVSARSAPLATPRGARAAAAFSGPVKIPRTPLARGWETLVEAGATPAVTD
jgi:putative chitinase